MALTVVSIAKLDHEYNISSDYVLYLPWSLQINKQSCSQDQSSKTKTNTKTSSLKTKAKAKTGTFKTKTETKTTKNSLKKRAHVQSSKQ